MNIKMITAMFLFVAALTNAAPAFAQQYNCQDPQYQQEMNFCAAQEYKAADIKLNQVYQKAIAYMKEVDGYQPPQYVGAEKALRQAERDWIKFRDSTCIVEGYLFRGGTMEPLMISTCKTRQTQLRIKDLQALFEVYG